MTAPFRITGETLVRIPTLETARLRLRAPEMRDFEAFSAFRTSERSRGVGGPYPASAMWGQFLALAGHWAQRGFGRWIVEERDSGEAVGLVGPFFPDTWPEPEIAWSLFNGAEGKGYAQEAAAASLAYAKTELGWTRAVSLIMASNTRSVALAERLGAVLEGDYAHPELGALQVWRHDMGGAQ